MDPLPRSCPLFDVLDKRFPKSKLKRDGRVVTVPFWLLC